MLFRGYIVDYIGLPGLITADLKEIFIAIGIAPVLPETQDNPILSWRWVGWQNERDDLIRLVKSFWNFSIQELHNVFQSIMNKFGKTTKYKQYPKSHPTPAAVDPPASLRTGSRMSPAKEAG